MPKDVDFRADRATFPHRCVSCAGPADTTAAVECTSGVDLLLIKFSRNYDFALPSCSHCARRRKRAGIVFYTLAILEVFGVLFGMFALEPYFRSWGHRNLWLWLLVASFFGSGYFARNWLSPLLDARFLGVRGVRLTKAGIGTLRFRDPEFAAEAAALSRETAEA